MRVGVCCWCGRYNATEILVQVAVLKCVLKSVALRGKTV